MCLRLARLSLLLSCLFTLSTHARSQTSQNLTLDACLQKIDSLFRTQQGTFALAFKDLSKGGTQLLINEHAVFHAASTMKTAILVEIHRQASRHLLRLDDSILLKNAFTSIADSSTFQLDSADDSETELYRHLGEKRTIDQLVYQMITVSSNFATNLLIDRVGPANVTATMNRSGLGEVHVLRGVEDNKAYQKGLNNTVTAAGLESLFEKMAKGRLVSRTACKDMIRVLLDQHYNEIIPAGLPAGTKVAHKTGWIKGINHDAGIVFLPDGRKYVLVLLSKDLTEDKAGIKTLAAVSALIYRYVTQQ